MADGRRRPISKARSKFERWILQNGGTGEVGKMLGVHQVTIGNWLGRRCRPNTDAVAKIIKLSKGKISFNDIIEATKCK